MRIYFTVNLCCVNHFWTRIKKKVNDRPVFDKELLPKFRVRCVQSFFMRVTHKNSQCVINWIEDTNKKKNIIKNMHSHSIGNVAASILNRVLFIGIVCDYDYGVRMKNNNEFCVYVYACVCVCARACYIFEILLLFSMNSKKLKIYTTSIEKNVFLNRLALYDFSVFPFRSKMRCPTWTFNWHSELKSEYRFAVCTPGSSVHLFSFKIFV